jgi:hypothetical protein
MSRYIQLLSDERGVYGLSDAYSLRPDRVQLDGGHWYALQQIPRKRFCHTIEGHLADSLHRVMCVRHGLVRSDGLWRSWSEAPDPVLARKTYHGLKRASLRIVNSAIRKGLDVADQRALKAARRFPISCRGSLYTAFCTYGERAIQLSEAFPLLAAVLFTKRWQLSDDDPFENEKKRRKSDEIRLKHIELVLAGVKLKRIADSFGLSYSFRRVKPGAVRGVGSTKWFSSALDYLPKTTTAQRMFFRIGRLAQDAELDFAPWMAELARQSRMRGELSQQFEDIFDWVKAARKRQYLADGVADIQARGEAALVDFLERGRETWQVDGWQSALFTRPYSPRMSLRTVRKLSHGWHEAVANNMSGGALQKFPSPWIDGAEFNHHKIVPIQDSRDLYLTAKTLHNCAVTYADAILKGQCYLYSVTNGDGKTPAVMVELRREKEAAKLGQIKSYCNGPAPKEIERGVRRWFNVNKDTLKLPAQSRHMWGRDDSDIPF